jgi:hypothetical protein
MSRLPCVQRANVHNRAMSTGCHRDSRPITGPNRYTSDMSGTKVPTNTADIPLTCQPVSFHVPPPPTSRQQCVVQHPGPTMRCSASETSRVVSRIYVSVWACTCWAAGCCGPSYHLASHLKGLHTFSILHACLHTACISPMCPINSVPWQATKPISCLLSSSQVCWQPPFPGEQCCRSLLL